MKYREDGKQIRSESSLKQESSSLGGKNPTIKPWLATLHRHPMCYHPDKHVLFPWISVLCSVLRVIFKLGSREAKYLSRSHLRGVREVWLAAEVQTGAAESMAEADPSSLPGRGSFAFQPSTVGIQPALAAQEKSWINARPCWGTGTGWQHCWASPKRKVMD